MLGFDSIEELDDFFADMKDSEKALVEHPINVFDTLCDNGLRVHGIKMGNRLPGDSRVDTCAPTLDVLTQEEIYYCFGMNDDDTPELKSQIMIARHATGLHKRGYSKTVLQQRQDQWLHSMKGDEEGNAYDMYELPLLLIKFGADMELDVPTEWVTHRHPSPDALSLFKEKMMIAEIECAPQKETFLKWKACFRYSLKLKPDILD